VTFLGAASMSIDLDTGTDKITLSDYGATLTVSNVESVVGGSGDDNITVSTSTASGYSLGDGDDSLTFSVGVTATVASVEHVTGSGSDDNVSLKANYDGGTFDLGGGSDTLVFLGAGTATISNVEIVTGSSRDNDVTVLTDGVTADLGGGNDIIHVAGGTNQLTGGSGSDEFHFTAASTGANTITDFTEGSDMVVLDHGVITGSLTYLGDDGVFTAGGTAEAMFDVSNNALKIDTNGDGNADITITLTGIGSGTLDSSDISWS
jgi:hypothetical protein